MEQYVVNMLCSNQNSADTKEKADLQVGSFVFLKLTSHPSFICLRQ